LTEDLIIDCWDLILSLFFNKDFTQIEQIGYVDSICLDIFMLEYKPTNLASRPTQNPLSLTE